MANLFFDSCARADNDSLGAPWVERLGDWDILSNAIRKESGADTNNVAHIGTVSTPDYSVSVDINASVNVSQHRGPCIRRLNFSTTDSDCYTALLTTTGADLDLYLRQSGGYTKLDDQSASYGATFDTVKIEAQGTAIRTYFNGTLKSNIVNSVLTAAGDAGLFCGNVDDQDFKNFSVDSFDTGVNIGVPAALFTLNEQVPNVGTGKIILSPASLFTLTDNVPQVGTSANIQVPNKTITLTGQVPVIAAGGAGPNIQVPAQVISLSGGVPGINIGVNIKPPNFRFYLNDMHAVRFDGVNDYLLRGADLTGSVDGKQGTISFWLAVKVDDTNMRVLDNTNQNFIVAKNSLNVLDFRGDNNLGSEVLKLVTNSTYKVVNGFNHFLASWNLNTPEGYLYVNDVNDLNNSTKILVNDDIDYAGSANFSIGALVAGSFKLNAEISDLWFDPTFINISIAANRRKFITAAKQRVELGSNGQFPTGSPPILFITGKAVDWNAGINKGSGGNFTMNGAVVDVNNDLLYAPAVGTGALILSPAGTFTLISNTPGISAGANVIVPAQVFNLLKNIPQVGTSVKITVPVELFTLNASPPNVAIITSVILAVPTGTFTLTGNSPAIDFILNLLAPSKQFTLLKYIPDVHSVSPAVKSAQFINPNAPSITNAELRYFYDNFKLLQDLLKEGITGQFKTTDGKTIHIRNGIITDIFTT